MQTIMRSSRVTLRIIITIVILLVVLGQPALVTGRSGGTDERAASQVNLIPAVVYRSDNGHIHELALKGSWQHRDLIAATTSPLSLSNPMAFQRSDGVSMVVYVGYDKHIHSLYLELLRHGNDWQEVWYHADLSAITGAPDARSSNLADPFGYVRSDGINAVVYPCSDGHIHELRLEGGTWIWADLTKLSDAPLAAFWTEPFAYDRGDGVNAIVYASETNKHIIELRLDNGWVWADLNDISEPNAPLPVSQITAYVRSDGIPTVNYLGIDRHIHDIRLETAWYYYDLTVATGAPNVDFWSSPYGYVRGDSINAIVYTAGAYPDQHIYEIYLDNTWQHYELTSIPNAVLGSNPIGYVRSDGLSAVVYWGCNDDHIHEIRLETTWQWADLTFLAGAPPGGIPWPYNRSAVGYAYLPLILR